MEKIGRTKIVDLLKRTDIGAMVNVKGWVRTRRGSKQVRFQEQRKQGDFRVSVLGSKKVS